MDEQTVNRGKFLLDYLRSSGQDDYGCVISSADVLAALEICYPEKASKAVYDELSLIELNAVGYVRDVFLKEGKYFGKTASGYRIPLPSENVKYINQYIMASDRKLSRAMKLTRNTPPGDAMPERASLDARIAMKRESLGARSIMGAVKKKAKGSK